MVVLRLSGTKRFSCRRNYAVHRTPAAVSQDGRLRASSGEGRRAADQSGIGFHRVFTHTERLQTQLQREACSKQTSPSSVSETAREPLLHPAPFSRSIAASTATHCHSLSLPSLPSPGAFAANPAKNTHLQGFALRAVYRQQHNSPPLPPPKARVRTNWQRDTEQAPAFQISGTRRLVLPAFCFWSTGSCGRTQKSLQRRRASRAAEEPTLTISTFFHFT